MLGTFMEILKIITPVLLASAVIATQYLLSRTGKTIWINYSNYYLGSNCLYAYYRDFRIEINWDHPFNNYCRAFY